MGGEATRGRCRLIAVSRERIVGAAFLSLWRHLGGGDIWGRRAVAFWRNGKRGSVAVDVERGFFWDHGTGKGGDAVDLVRLIFSLDTGAALQWLEAQGYRRGNDQGSDAEGGRGTE